MGGLPFTVDGLYQVFNYITSHSTLTLRRWYGQEPLVEIRFDGVERMELDKRFSSGLTIAPVAGHGDLDDGAPIPLLLLKLTGGTHGSGFVACSRVTAHRITLRPEKRLPDYEEALLVEHAHHSEHAVGGRTLEPGELLFGQLPARRGYDLAKRGTARFPPPGPGWTD